MGKPDDGGLAERLIDLRQSRGWSQRSLSERSGISHGFISRIELKERYPSIRMIRTLAKTLGVSEQYLETGRNGHVLSVTKRERELLVDLLDEHVLEMIASEGDSYDRKPATRLRGKLVTAGKGQ